jgi:sulfur carrier protein
MIELIINGEKKTFQENISLSKVIKSLKVQDKVMASAVNMDIVKKDNWDKYILKNNDKIELLQFVGGG